MTGKELLVALGVGTAAGAVVYLINVFEPLSTSSCVHLSNGFMPGQIVVINSRFMLCTALSESSVDVECREMKETPCVDRIGVRK